MRILYINRGASPSTFAAYLERYQNRLQQQGQKYNQLLMEGLVQNGAQVNSISTRPLGRSVTRQFYFRRYKEQECGIAYDYLPFFNYKGLRELSVLFGVFFRILFAKGSRKDTVVICDALNIMASAAALAAAALRGFTTVGIVTDVPCHRPNTVKVPLNEKINLSLMKRFDKYLLLTEQMNEVVNPKRRPYVVMEGHADTAMAQVDNRFEDKAQPRVCLYAGSLRKIYGIGNLVQGFLKANVPNTELHVYGSGDFAVELTELSKQNPQIKYHGVVPNTDIVKTELSAMLLINPRPTDEDYTKYSFPSKNMEYMASGTPVLTTKLPGMPADHLPHVYLIEEETADGIAAVLSDLLNRDASELHEKGKAAKAFVLGEKNNVSQARKLLDLLNA